jgi:type III restriction enzyme
VVLDTQTWEASAAFRLEQSPAVRCYARNDELGLTIPYEYQGIDHAYTPDFLVQLVTQLNVVLEIKGYEDDEARAKQNAARRWVSAVNNWGGLGRWTFHVCRDPHLLVGELARLAQAYPRAVGVLP